MKCWRKTGCNFNSNHSLQYMKCLQEEYSVEKCKEDQQKEYIKDNVIDGFIYMAFALE